VVPSRKAQLLLPSQGIAAGSGITENRQAKERPREIAAFLLFGES
jgi:hypothetical protein